MLVVKDGTSLIAAGLDHWFKPEEEDDKNIIKIDAFKIEEWRLQKRFNVDHFRLPPDYRRPFNPFGNAEKVNTRLTVPFLRFPQWHFCPVFTCRRLALVPLVLRKSPECPDCAKRGRKVRMVQVPIIAMCEDGHIQDFPWREWVHRTESPECQQPMKLIATGGASLAAQKVVCGCNRERNLASITEGYTDRTTFLSKNLNAGEGVFYCRGCRPWTGEETESGCSNHLRGSLRSASNVYYAQVRSAIFLPQTSELAPGELVELLTQPPLTTAIDIAQNFDHQVTPAYLRKHHFDLLVDFTDEQITASLNVLSNNSESQEEEEINISDSDYESRFRRAEFKVLREPQNESQLLSRKADLTKYTDIAVKFFSRILLVDKLRETRVLTGFTRVYAENDIDQASKAAMLWKSPPKNPAEAWLPAYMVFGEGIFFEFDENRLQEWERSFPAIQNRVSELACKNVAASGKRGISYKEISPRFLLLHTFSHLLMNQLTFECGYSSAALRERLFVSTDTEAPMAGLLIYTADGDAEGTMGGLVRMGKSGYLEPVIQRAIEAARWCSADPVCMETGASGGQGPDSCNLAACHSCSLVPETACEEFNRFLDRAVIVGDGSSNIPPYFDF
jgi:hypothetical protein